MKRSKKNIINKVNILAEQRYLSSKGIFENIYNMSDLKKGEFILSNGMPINPDEVYSDNFNWYATCDGVKYKITGFSDPNIYTLEVI